MKKLIFWDWENTLVSKKLYVNFFIKNTASQANKNSIDINSSVNKLSTQEINEVKTKMVSKPWFIPYGWALVKKFSEMGVKQAIVSNGSKAMLENHLKLAPYSFEYVCSSTEFKPKPELEMFFHVLKKTGLTFSDAVFIADSASDEIAAKNAKMDFFKVDGEIESYYKIFKFFNF